MSGDETSAQVVRKIQSRDSKYRAFFVSLMLLVFFTLMGVMYLQGQALQEFRGQSAERAASLKKLQQQTLVASGRTNSYLQCLARYFVETDRAELQLTDLDKCSYERNGQSVPGIDVSPSSGSAPSLTQAPSPEPSTPATVQQTPTAPTMPAQPPIEVLPSTPRLLQVCASPLGLCIVL